MCEKKKKREKSTLSPLPHRNDNNGHQMIDQSNRSMLHLCRGITLCMNVRNLLHLQRSLQGDRIVHTSTKEEEVGRIAVLLGDGFELLGVVLQDNTDKVRDGLEAAQQRLWERGRRLGFRRKRERTNVSLLSPSP